MTTTLKKALLIAAVLILAVATLPYGGGASAALTVTIDPQLTEFFAARAAGATVPVVITYSEKPGAAEFSRLELAGINKGFATRELPMVIADMNAAQLQAVSRQPGVLSIYGNSLMQNFTNASRRFIGVQQMTADTQVTKANRNNPGFPISGKGIGIGYIDTGIDATHKDLTYGKKTVQNVIQPLSETVVSDGGLVLGVGVSVGDILNSTGFVPPIYLEDQPMSDVESGHGTHGAAVAAGTGEQSGGFYGGVARGAHLVGVNAGNDLGLPLVAIIGAFDYLLATQYQYNIRVINNSWGSSGDFNPDNPINIATKAAYDSNIISVFAAGNSGPGRDTHNPYAKAPWVISVAAGTKEGGLASFSSRGLPKEDRLADADPNNDYDAPTITAPGTGREFASNASKFSAAYVSARSKTNMFSNGLDDDAELAANHLPYYTQISGTSMAAPHVAGVVALMLDADPTLTPDEVKQILVETASRMPGYEEWQVGAGYVNAYAAVDKVFNRAKNYRNDFNHTFNAQYTVSGPEPDRFRINYTPAALPGPGSANSRELTVAEGMSELLVLAKFDNIAESGDGNTIGILLTSPSGQRFSSGIALPILDAPNREVMVKNPEPGKWLLEVRGVRGLAALPNVSLPTSGAAAPGPVDFTVYQKLYTLDPIGDIAGHAAQAQIETVLKNRQMDTFADGTFRPGAVVTREDFARMLYMNTALRQFPSKTQKYSDVTPEFSAIAEAVTANGSTLRDWSFAPAGMVSAYGPTFNPTANTTRLETAVALVRALGLDAEAKQKAGTIVTANYNGQLIPLADNAEIPSALRGYVQFALDKGLLQAFYTLEQGPFDFQPVLKARVKANDATTRAFMAYALDNFRRRFAAGN